MMNSVLVRIIYIFLSLKLNLIYNYTILHYTSIDNIITLTFYKLTKIIVVLYVEDILNYNLYGVRDTLAATGSIKPINCKRKIYQFIGCLMVTITSLIVKV